MRRGGLGALLGIALAVSSEAGAEDDLARELPRIKSRMGGNIRNGPFVDAPGPFDQRGSLRPQLVLMLSLDCNVRHLCP